MGVMLVFPIQQSKSRMWFSAVFAEGVEEKNIAPRTDSVTLHRPKSPRRVVSTEQDMNCSGIKGDSTASEPCNHSCRRRSLPPNAAVTEVGGLVHKHFTLFPPNEISAEQSRCGGQ